MVGVQLFLFLRISYSKHRYLIILLHFIRPYAKYFNCRQQNFMEYICCMSWKRLSLSVYWQESNTQRRIKLKLFQEIQRKTFNCSKNGKARQEFHWSAKSPLLKMLSSTGKAIKSFHCIVINGNGNQNMGKMYRKNRKEELITKGNQ